MRMIGLVLVGVFLAGAAGAQSIVAPKVTPSDTWIYQDTLDGRAGWKQTRVESTVVRAGTSSIVVSNKPVGSSNPPVEFLLGPDWSRLRSVNGQETVVNQPLSFPLRIGKSWDIDFTEDQPNRLHSSEHWRTSYKVTGWDDVTVPAGTFHALKIEAEGSWSAVMAPASTGVAGTRTDGQGTTAVVQTARTGPMTVTGRTYRAVWYAPGVKRLVKSDEEFFDSNGVRYLHFLSELMSYKVAD